MFFCPLTNDNLYEPNTMWTKNITHCICKELTFTLIQILNKIYCSCWIHIENIKTYIYSLPCVASTWTINPENATDTHVNLDAISMHIDMPHWIFGRFLPGKLYVVHCHHQNLTNKKRFSCTVRWIFQYELIEQKTGLSGTSYLYYLVGLYKLTFDSPTLHCKKRL